MFVPSFFKFSLPQHSPFQKAFVSSILLKFFLLLKFPILCFVTVLMHFTQSFPLFVSSYWFLQEHTSFCFMHAYCVSQPIASIYQSMIDSFFLSSLPVFKISFFTSAVLFSTYRRACDNCCRSMVTTLNPRVPLFFITQTHDILWAIGISSLLFS